MSLIQYEAKVSQNPEQLQPNLQQFIDNIKVNKGQLDWFINFQTLFKSDNQNPYDHRQNDYSKTGWGHWLLQKHQGKHQTKRYTDLKITHDGRYLISVDDQNKMRIWDLQ